MTFLLDINVLIALIDPTHMQHGRAHTWFASSGKKGWATCPLTENGTLRIVGHRSYPNSPGTPAAVVELLKGLRGLPGHEFWADDVTLFDPRLVHSARLLDSGQLTDTYLLALASAHGGKLATFDQSIVTSTVTGGAGTLHIIG